MLESSIIISGFLAVFEPPPEMMLFMSNVGIDPMFFYNCALSTGKYIEDNFFPTLVSGNRSIVFSIDLLAAFLEV